MNFFYSIFFLILMHQLLEAQEGCSKTVDALVDQKNPSIIQAYPAITFKPYNDNRHHIEINNRNPDNPCAHLYGTRLKQCMECRPREQFHEQLKKFNDEQLRHYFLQLSFDEYLYLLSKFDEKQWQELKESRKNPTFIKNSLHENRILAKQLLCAALGYGVTLSGFIGAYLALKWYGIDFQKSDDLDTFKHDYYLAQSTNAIPLSKVFEIHKMYELMKRGLWS